jgi:hypothetical protein
MPVVRGPLRLVLDDERAEVNVNGNYDKGFVVTVLASGSVSVESEHFQETVLYDYVLFGHKSVEQMKKAVKRTKKRLQKKENRLLAMQEEFNG